MGLATTLCRSSLSDPFCPLKDGQISKQQPANSDSPPRLVTIAVRQALRSYAVDAMQCSINCRGVRDQCRRIARTQPMVRPLTRKMGLDAMEQSGSSKGRYCLVQPAWLVPAMQRLDLPGCWFDLASELRMQEPKGQLPGLRTCRITNARNEALSR